MKKEQITNVDILKQYLSEEYSDQNWYEKSTEEDFNNLLHLIETDSIKLKDIPDSMLEIQTRRLLETMSD